MTRQQRMIAIRLAAFLIACLGVFLYVYHMAGGGLIPGQHGYRVEAIVPDAFGLSTNADVREAGVQIGKVTDSRNIGSTTALMLDIDRSHAPVYSDATVLVRTKSVAGEPYLQLDPGHPQAGEVPDGGRLAPSHALEATQLDQILSVFSPARRRQVQLELEGLGGGLRGHGADLNNLLQYTSEATVQGEPLTATLAGDRTHVASLIDSLGRVTQALGARAAAIGLLVRQAKTVAQAVDARDTQLSRSLDELPSFLAQVRSTGAHLFNLSGDATPVVRNLRLAIDALTPALVDLKTAAPAGRRLIRSLGPFAGAIREPVSLLGPFSAVTANAVPAIEALLRQTNPALAYLSPYWRELSDWFAQTGAAAKYADPIGHVGRLALTFGSRSLPATLAPTQQKMVRQLEALAGGAADSAGANAYPSPSAAGGTAPFTGSYPRLQPDPPYGMPRGG